MEGGFSLKCIYDIVLAGAALLWPKYERQITSTDAVAVQVRVIGITNIDALNNLGF